MDIIHIHILGHFVLYTNILYLWHYVAIAGAHSELPQGGGRIHRWESFYLKSILFCMKTF